MSLLTNEDIITFKKDGVILVKNILSKEWQTKMAKAIEETVTNKSLTGKFISGKDNGGFAGDIDLWYRNDAFYDFMLHSPCAKYAQLVLNSEVVRHFYDQTFIKPSRCNLDTPWHQYITFWPVHL